MPSQSESALSGEQQAYFIGAMLMPGTRGRISPQTSLIMALPMRS